MDLQGAGGAAPAGQGLTGEVAPPPQPQPLQEQQEVQASQDLPRESAAPPQMPLQQPPGQDQQQQQQQPLAESEAPASFRNQGNDDQAQAAKRRALEAPNGAPQPSAVPTHNPLSAGTFQPQEQHQMPAMSMNGAQTGPLLGSVGFHQQHHAPPPPQPQITPPATQSNPLLTAAATSVQGSMNLASQAAQQIGAASQSAMQRPLGMGQSQMAPSGSIPGSVLAQSGMIGSQPAAVPKPEPTEFKKTGNELLESVGTGLGARVEIKWLLHDDETNEDVIEWYKGRIMKEDEPYDIRDVEVGEVLKVPSHILEYDADGEFESEKRRVCFISPHGLYDVVDGALQCWRLEGETFDDEEAARKGIPPDASDIRTMFFRLVKKEQQRITQANGGMSANEAHGFAQQLIDHVLQTAQERLEESYGMSVAKLPMQQRMSVVNRIMLMKGDLEKRLTSRLMEQGEITAEWVEQSLLPEVEKAYSQGHAPQGPPRQDHHQHHDDEKDEEEEEEDDYQDEDDDE